MDMDGIVEDVYDEVNTPSASGPNFVVSLFNLVTSTFESYGWFLVIGLVLGYFLYEKFKQNGPRNVQSKSKRVDEDEALRLAERIEQARLRQQAQFDASKAKFLEEKRLKEEKAAKEKAEEWERHKQGLGYRSKTKPNSPEEDLSKLGLAPSLNAKNKPKLRDSDFNPLTGTSSSDVCYRPRRDCGPRGGG